jgi:hypothetical protein
MDKHIIGVFGDSFATSNVGPEVQGTPWPTTLAKNLNRTLECHAHPGTSIWWSYVKFLEHHEKYDTIIFTYSQHNRWHHLSEECLTMYHLTVPKHYNSVPESTPEREKIAKILYDAYRYVSSEQLDLFIYQNVFDSVNKICKEKNIRLINVMPFEHGENGKMFIDCSNRAGLVIYNFDGLTKLERSRLTEKQDEDLWNMINSSDRRPCHISSYHNDLVASVIADFINNDDLIMMDISKDPRASFDPIHNSMYYDL